MDMHIDCRFGNSSYMHMSIDNDEAIDIPINTLVARMIVELVHRSLQYHLYMVARLTVLFLYLRHEQRIFGRVRTQRTPINVAREKGYEEVTTRVDAS